MSVQASDFNYCSPRRNLIDSLSYYEFEVGFPSERVEEFMIYAEEAECPTETVYGWVPWEVIQGVINRNGGINHAQISLHK